MKKTTKILLGILIATGILHLSLMYIPQLFRTDHLVHYAPLTPIETKDNDTIPTTTTKTIDESFNHIVFTNNSNCSSYGTLFICRKSADKINHTKITYPNELADVYSFKIVNDTLHIRMSKIPDAQSYPNHIDINIEMPGELKSITNASYLNIDICNFEVDSFDIIYPNQVTTTTTSGKDKTRPNPFYCHFEMGIYRCKIKQLNNYSEAKINVVESEIENLHQSQRTWSVKQGDFPCNNDSSYYTN